MSCILIIKPMEESQSGKSFLPWLLETSLKYSEQKIILIAYSNLIIELFIILNCLILLKPLSAIISSLLNLNRFLI